MNSLQSALNGFVDAVRPFLAAGANVVVKGLIGGGSFPARSTAVTVVLAVAFLYLVVRGTGKRRS